MKDYPITPLPFTAVRFKDAFWAPRLETNRQTTIPLAFRKCEETGRVQLFDRAAAALRGGNPDRTKPGYPFDETDVYKTIEGAAYSLQVKADPALESYVDGLVKKIEAAQEPDGYLYPARTIYPPDPHDWSGKERWQLEKELSHELYNLGHLFEAAVAWKEATGKDDLLKVALRAAEMLDRTFGKGKRSIWPGHQIVEMGLVKLYRVTGEERYLKLAQFFLDERGPGGSAVTQAHEKVTAQSEAVGHAVRATYLYAGMADVAALAGPKGYLEALDRLWENVVGKKLYLTGGVGALHDGEAFGKDYELPNATAYCETCAAIGNVYWNHRLFLLHGHAKYLDVLERTLYNGLLSGLSLDGASFFYPNPLESKGGYGRSPWFGCACCPGNLCRFMASVPGYAYAREGRTLFVNLYVAGEADLLMPDGLKVRLTVETRYPWEGEIIVKAEPERPAKFKMALRIPGWSLNRPVPSDLYRFSEDDPQKPSLKVNGQTAALDLDKGFAVLEREWRLGDVLQLNLPMPVRRVLAHEAVEADRGRVALQRGPLVYCVEEADQNGGPIRDLALTGKAPLHSHFQADLLGGVQTLSGMGGSRHPFTAIPYYAWANRGPGEMAVWLRT